MGTTWVKYPWKPEQGQQITQVEMEAGQRIYDKVTGWCEQHALGQYNVDPTLYARGIKVKFEMSEDTKALKAFMK